VRGQRQRRGAMHLPASGGHAAAPGDFTGGELPADRPRSDD
jgi:hypothetical protein